MSPMRRVIALACAVGLLLAWTQGPLLVARARGSFGQSRPVLSPHETHPRNRRRRGAVDHVRPPLDARPEDLRRPGAVRSHLVPRRRRMHETQHEPRSAVCGSEAQGRRLLAVDAAHGNSVDAHLQQRRPRVSHPAQPAPGRRQDCAAETDAACARPAVDVHDRPEPVADPAASSRCRGKRREYSRPSPSSNNDDHGPTAASCPS